MEEEKRRKAAPQPEAAKSLKFLYQTIPGRIVLSLLSGRIASKIAGKWMSSRFSRGRIERFIAANGINMDEYVPRDYKSFNDFFTREIKPERRPVDPNPHALCSPCDARLTVYRISEGVTFPVKNTRYSVADMLGDAGLAARFDGGHAMVFRLAVDNYHRVCFFDGGRKGASRFIPGRLHTVQAIATDTGHDIFARNCRSVSVIESDGFGSAAMIYIGALMVGRIVENHPEACAVTRGEEAGMFEFGGSTVVLLLEKDAATLDRDIIEASAHGLETPVKYGERIGTSDRI